MTRTYLETIDVRGDAAAGRFRPGQFLWRGRLYVVRDVLAHWYERTAWWDGAARAASLDASEGGDREVWRVEASPGRSAGSGVYDLCAVTGGSGHVPQWRLVRVSD